MFLVQPNHAVNVKCEYTKCTTSLTICNYFYVVCKESQSYATELKWFYLSPKFFQGKFILSVTSYVKLISLFSPCTSLSLIAFYTNISAVIFADLRIGP